MTMTAEEKELVRELYEIAIKALAQLSEPSEYEQAVLMEVAAMLEGRL